MKFKDYYEVMGLPKDASADDIKRTYRKLARKFHPDVSKEADAEARFKEVGEAYEVLRDPEKRRAYDQLGSRYHEGQEFRPPPDWDFEFSTRTADHEAFSDFFEQLFGGMGAHGARRGFQMAGHNTTAQVSITLEEAFSGATRSLMLETSEADEHGRARPKTKQLNVKIPAGVMDGQQIRLAGQGEPGIGGGQAGDLLLNVRIAPHRYFRVDGRDVFLDLPITPWEAALGGKVRIPTLAGRVDLQVPKGSQAGRELRLKGKGLPGKPPGDLRVILKIVIPDAATADDEALYQRMAEQMPMNPRAALES